MQESRARHQEAQKGEETRWLEEERVAMERRVKHQIQVCFIGVTVSVTCEDSLAAFLKAAVGLPVTAAFVVQQSEQWLVYWQSEQWLVCWQVVLIKSCPKIHLEGQASRLNMEKASHSIGMVCPACIRNGAFGMKVEALSCRLDTHTYCGA